MKLFEAEGTLRYSVQKPASDQNWWLILDVSSEALGKYYRHLYWLEHSKAQKISKPYWGTHITVVRNEEPPKKDLWCAHEGELVTFQYMAGVRDNESPDRFRSFYWLDVKCPRFEEIRLELGLNKNPDGIYHSTIGSVENEANRHVYDAMWA